MKLFTLSFFLLLMSSFHRPVKLSFEEFTRQFANGYAALQIPGLSLSYVDNLQHIPAADNLEKQVLFFTQSAQELSGYARTDLTRQQQQDHRQMGYEIGLNLERLALEKEWNAHRPAEISANGLYSLPDGKAWYAYFLKKWLGDTVTPAKIFLFGWDEVKRVNEHIEAIQKQTGMDDAAFYKHLNTPAFFEKDPLLIHLAFEQARTTIYDNMSKLFTPRTVPELRIAKGTNASLAQTPGYYTNNTFYYNLFDQPYNKRQVDWLFIHEAVPGHHYQVSLANALQDQPLQREFQYPGFSEGWGAYVEELGKDLGVYRTIYDELGKWEWDIVRSVRVPLDVGINYYGWTDAQALAFWKEHIHNQDAIALREIARVKRWPAQAITYKYGAVQLLNWKEELQQREGAAFNIRDFHNRVLDHGSLPLFLVKENVLH